MGGREPVDPDDPRTWPENVAERIAQLATSLDGTAESVSDLDLHDEEDLFRELLSGHLLRTYHCTRLLDHEVEMVREQGLRALDEDLLHDRFDAALARGYISEQNYAAFHDAHVFNGDRSASQRQDRVCLILGRSHLESDWPYGVEPLLTTWGGEGLYMGAGALDLRPLLKTLGRPSIIVATVDLSEPHRSIPVWPGVANVFVGTALHLEEPGADVIYPRSIPADQVEEVW